MAFFRVYIVIDPVQAKWRLVGCSRAPRVNFGSADDVWRPELWASKEMRLRSRRDAHSESKLRFTQRGTGLEILARNGSCRIAERAS